MLCDSYTVYNAGLHEARTLLSQLNGYTEFSSYMNKLSNPELKMDITQFLNRPMKVYIIEILVIHFYSSESNHSQTSVIQLNS